METAGIGLSSSQEDNCLNISVSVVSGTFPWKYIIGELKCFFFEYFNQQTEDRHEPANAIYPDERRQGAPDGKEDWVQSVDAEAESSDEIEPSVDAEAEIINEIEPSVDAEAESINEIERSVDAEDPKPESNDLTGSPYSYTIFLSGSTCLSFDHVLEVNQGPDIFNVGMFGAIKTNQKFHSNLFKSRIFCGLEIVTESKL